TWYYLPPLLVAIDCKRELSARPCAPTATVEILMPLDLYRESVNGFAGDGSPSLIMIMCLIDAGFGMNSLSAIFIAGSKSGISPGCMRPMRPIQIRCRSQIRARPFPLAACFQSHVSLPVH